MKDDEHFNNNISARTYIFNPAPMNVSGPAGSDPLGNSRGNLNAISLRTLIPSQPASTKIFAHYMPWFYENPTPFDKADTGYISDQAEVVQYQLSDMQARGYDGLVVSWGGSWGSGVAAGGSGLCRDKTSSAFDVNATYPYNSNFGTACNSREIAQNSATQRVASALNTVPNTYGMQYAISEVDQAFSQDDQCAGPPVGDTHPFKNNANQPACVEERMEIDFHYADENFLQHPGYYTAPSGSPYAGRPVIPIFIDEASWFNNCSGGCVLQGGTTCFNSTDCWAKIWTYLAGVAASLPSQPILIFRDCCTFQGQGQGERHVQSDGMFLWIHPRPELGLNITDVSQKDYQDSTEGPYLTNWYTEAACTRTGACASPSAVIGKLAVGGVYKGFDKYLAFCGDSCYTSGTISKVSGKYGVMSQECGSTWINTWAKVDAAPIGAPLDMVVRLSIVVSP